MSQLASPLCRSMCWVLLLGLVACSSSPAPPAQHPVAPGSTTAEPEQPSAQAQMDEAASMERDALIQITTSLAHGLRLAATLLLQTSPGRCPTADEVVATKLVSPHLSVVDAWDQHFDILCTEDQVIVRSVGPDGVTGTVDDILAGEP